MVDFVRSMELALLDVYGVLTREVDLYVLTLPVSTLIFLLIIVGYVAKKTRATLIAIITVLAAASIS